MLGSMLTYDNSPLLCVFVFCILLVRGVAGQGCAMLTSCTRCVVCIDPSNLPLQLYQKPDFIQTLGLQILNSYTTDSICNITCKWDRKSMSCSDWPRSAAMDGSSNFVYPQIEGTPDITRLDLYYRMQASKYCESPTGNSCSDPRILRTLTTWRSVH